LTSNGRFPTKTEQDLSYSVWNPGKPRLDSADTSSVAQKPCSLGGEEYLDIKRQVPDKNGAGSVVLRLGSLICPLLSGTASPVHPDVMPFHLPHSQSNAVLNWTFKLISIRPRHSETSQNSKLQSRKLDSNVQRYRREDFESPRGCGIKLRGGGGERKLYAEEPSTLKSCPST
jgi:hypothetical protein